MGDKKRHEVILGGTGGQGVITIGYILAEAAARSYQYVTRFPIYMATMRGGPAYCTVIFSDQEIAAPILSRFDNAVAMESGAYSRFKPGLKPGGNFLVNSSIVKKLDENPSFRTFPVPVTDLAQETGMPAMANLIMLGAYQGVTHALAEELIQGAIQKVMAPEGDGNEEKIKKMFSAYQRGLAYAREQKWS
jgi:2-oxoglutarate ferredoxin oxidoreductase subunit gamma